MKKLVAMILSGIGILSAGIGTMACSIAIIDEPVMSKNMIER